jgi:hypothetical protein
MSWKRKLLIVYVIALPSFQITALAKPRVMCAFVSRVV